MIGLQNVSKHYGRQALLAEASFQLNPGEKVGLVGPNGAGKSTIFRLLVREEQPDDGEVQALLDAGYSQQNLLDIIVGITMKTLTNYTNHIVKTPLNEAYEPQRWDATMYSQAAE